MKKSYQSKYGQNLEITAAQYIAEIICERIASKHKKGLPFEFWKDEHWAKIFKVQIVLANKYLKRYKADIIIKGLRHPKAKKVYSLGAGFILDQIFDEVKRDYVEPQGSIVEADVNDTLVKPQQISTNTNNPFKGLD